MRYLFLPACICLMTLSGAAGAAGADGISTEWLTGKPDEKATQGLSDPPPDAAAEQGDTGEPKAADVVADQALAADVPLPLRRPAPVKHRVVVRSRYEICSTLVESAHSNDLPLPFFIHLLFQESRFKPDVVSRAGAQGIAQFMPETAATVGLRNPFDPVQAIAASARLLGDLVRQFGNLGLAAAAYNAGPRRIRDWLDRKGKLPDETRHYVKTITGRPAENWKGRAPAALAGAPPREAPCQEAVRIVAAKADSKPALKGKERAIMVAERPDGKHGKPPRGHSIGRGKGGKGAIQLAASSKKKERKRKGARR